MAEPLKNAFGRPVVEAIAARLAAVHRGFDAAAFTAASLDGLEARELLDRGVHVAAALRAHLPADVPAALDVLVRSLGPPLPEAEDGFDGLGQGLSGFAYLPYVAFIRDHAADEAWFELAMAAQHALTRRFTAEWSIRPFLERWPERTLAVLSAWTEDPSCHVRRLVSEGTRPRLPWAARLRRLQADPSPGLELLERLRDDPSEYVRRSVANHLNDVGKDHPDVLVAVARRWLRGATPARRRLVRHALRTLVKQGHPEALALLGYGEPPRVDVEVVLRPLSAGQAPRERRIPEVPLGGAVEIGVTLRSRAREEQRLVVDLPIYFVKASGPGRGGAPRARKRARGEGATSPLGNTVRPKVFKLKALVLPARGEVTLAKRVSLAEMSTRVHRLGDHRVDVRVNGKDFPGGAFRVVEASGAAAPGQAAPRPPRSLVRRAR